MYITLYIYIYILFFFSVQSPPWCFLPVVPSQGLGERRNQHGDHG